MTIITIATKAGAKLFRKSLGNRDNPVQYELEEYYSPLEEIEIL